VVKQGFQDRRARAPSTGWGIGRHAAHPPVPGRALGTDEADGNQLLARECTNRESIGRLAARHLIE
jgi:hypothetical protein